MIVTQYKGQSFAATLRYISNKTGACLLGHNLFCSTLGEQTAAMAAVAEQSERVKRPMMHYAISLAPGEHLDDSQWRNLAKQYLKQMGYTDNQYLLVRHTDTPNHDHVHMVVNRVKRVSGRVVSLHWDYYQSQIVVGQLEEQFNLSQVRKSWEPPKEKLAGEQQPLLPLPPKVQHRQAAKEKIRGVINASLLGSQNLDEFIPWVESRGIKVELQQRQGKLKGIAFTADNERFSGSRLGPGYSLPKLLKAWQKAAVATDQTGQVEEPFHQRYYRKLVEVVERKMGNGLSVQEQDFQLAMLAFRSSKPDAAKALVFSPDVQRLKQEQGEQVAMDYLRQLMESAQQRLREMAQQTETPSRKKQPER